MYKLGALIIGVGLAIGFAAPASASVCSPSDYTSSNGATSYPGTFVGTVGTASCQVDQIGNISEFTDGNGGAFANTSHNPSIYEFYWGGGALDITEEREGGTQNLIAELQQLANQSSTSPSSTLTTTDIPAGADSTFFTLYDASLTAGYYAIDNYIPALVSDPEYQIDFATPAPAAVPEPLTLSIFGAGIAGAAALRRRKKAKQA